MKFENMNIEKNVLDSLSDMGFEQSTRIQSETIPLIKMGHDVIGQSETGSGKTAAFGIPVVDKVTKGKGIQALILAPTRELALQISSNLKKFSQLKGLYIQTVYGGVPMGPQINGFKRAEIIVGTPGRMLDHMRRGNLDLSKLSFFVLDEADKMINMGFIDDIETIERHIPKNRQTLLFSATMPRTLNEIRERFTKNAKKVKTKTKVGENVLKQYYCDIDHRKKFSLLVHLIKEENPELAIIFCNSRRDVDLVGKNLRDNGIKAKTLHGGLSQQRREKVLKDFNDGITRLLVATDVAARGLDIKNITHIFNYNIPKNPEEYVNRIGRTARAGETGKAISLLIKDDQGSMRKIIEKYSYNIEKMKISEFRIVPFRRNQSNRRESFHRNFKKSFNRGFNRNKGYHRR